MNVPTQPSVNIGLIGHVDHGKTTLAKALTGSDTPMCQYTDVPNAMVAILSALPKYARDAIRNANTRDRSRSSTRLATRH